MEKYDVVSCARCGFAYADNIPSQAAFNRYYSQMSKYEFSDKRGEVPASHLRHFKKIVDFIKPHMLDRKARILDVGCSTGGLLSVFRRSGYERLSGVDPSRPCAKAAKALYGIPVTPCNIFDFHEDGKFDLVVLSAVLEHVVDLHALLEKIGGLLREQGMLFIEVPDADRFDAYITAPFQQFSVEHINYFTRRSLGNLLERAFFEIVKVRADENKISEAIDPDIFLIARKMGGRKTRLCCDDFGVRKIRSYVARCSQEDLAMKKRVCDKLTGIKKVIVWGAGTHTQRLLGAGLDPSRVFFIADSNPRYWGKRLNGIPVMSPKGIHQEKIPILISTYSFQDEIAGQIKEGLKLKNKIIKLY